MNLKNFLLLAILTSLFACKNDIDINAPYKDIPIVYGFLDQNQEVQFIRIEKLYQNSGTLSTDQGAKIADSLYFDSLVVKIINIVSKDTFLCSRVDTISKDSGFFSNARNTLYACKLPRNNNANEIYQLSIYYPKKNLYFTATTPVVKDATIYPRRTVFRNDIPNHIFQFRFKTGRNSALYDLKVEFVYKEMNAADTNIFEFKTIVYDLAKSKDYQPERDVTENIVSRNYINYLKERIPADPSKVRRSMHVNFTTYGGAPEFRTMLDLNTPNLSIVQKNPQYSNISNGGIGIFSSRNYGERIQEFDFSTIILLSQELPNFVY
ncbi:MAG: hypothetical protein MH472_06255 [Bacteroidia bacterium]|nr:hypothetical protein [Bacteroidia bacterium]